MPARRPISLALRSYQVGFGDCFLLSFQYRGTTARHVLIDFGSTGRPRRAPTPVAIAEDIRAACGGKLHAIVATHRHRDHISGFAGASGRIIESLEPDVVIQPWTEDPDAAPDATRPSGALAGARGFVGALEHMHEVAGHALAEIARLRGPVGVLRQLAFLGETNLKNAEAVRRLQGLRARKVYASHGAPSGLARVLPGVTTRVLGPPTLEQSRAIASQRSTDPSEFWHFQALASSRGAGITPPLFRPRHRATSRALPFETRWFLPRLEAVRSEQLLEIVRILDDAMNNTSLILLFEAGDTTLLFPGDAQIENWQYALIAAPDAARMRQRLARTSVYKVGHHGSLNATPRTLWALFERKGDRDRPDRLRSFLSTMAGKHGSEDRGTEVPRGPLVAELEKRTTHVTTQSLTRTRPFVATTVIPIGPRPRKAARAR